MADFEGVAAIRGARLADLSQHVADVLSVALAAGDEYVVGTLSLESYEFVPYALTGLAAAMQTPGAGEPRASTVVTVPIRDDKAGTGQAQRPVTLYGPGDVLGVDPGQVVRRYPSPGSVNAEETFHAHIEFDRPELPWTFSAQTPGNTMRALARAGRAGAQRGRVGARPGRPAARDGRRRGPAAAGVRDRGRALGARAGAEGSRVPGRPAVHGVRAGQRLPAARRPGADAEHRLRRLPGAHHRRRRQGRAGASGRDPRRGLDPGRRPGAAAGLRPLGVPHRTGWRLRTAGPPARAAGGAVGDRPPDPGHLATRRPDRRPPRRSGRPPPGGALRPGLAQRPAARRTRGRRRAGASSGPGTCRTRWSVPRSSRATPAPTRARSPTCPWWDRGSTPRASAGPRRCPSTTGSPSSTPAR